MNFWRKHAFQFIGMRLASAGLLLCLLFPVAFVAQEEGVAVKDARYYTQEAVKAYRAKDYSGYLENIKHAQVLRPDHPTIMYNLAGAYALNGKNSEAVEWLKRVASMGLIYPAAEDEDFATIKDTEEFKSIIRQFEANESPVTHSVKAFMLDEKGLITEGLAYDPVTGTFFVSSVHKRKIVSINKLGEVRDFSSEQDGLWSVLGMKVDAKRRHLWVCTAALPQMVNFADGDKNHTGVFKYDLTSGKLLKKYLLPDTNEAHTFGDLAIHPSGDVYVTDSVTPAIYLIARKRDELELFAGPEPFASPQGLDFSTDGKKLFVADYGRGIFVFDVKSRKPIKMEQPANVSSLGIDGLYFHKGGLIAVQNGVNPTRVVRLILNKTMNRIEALEVIEANNASFDEPTLGVIVKGFFYFIANSQWESVSEKGQLAPMEKLSKPLVLKAPL
jgi:sugar lactone lactonase YvrE